jgi:hypothetical protein
MSRNATERRLRDHALSRLEPGEEIVVWTRAWVSKAGRLQRLAPRWRDVGVVTDRRLLLFSVGQFTRRPRRRVLADRLDELSLTDIGAQPGRRVRCARPGRAPMLLELGTDPWSRRLAQELQDRAGKTPVTATGPSVPVAAAGADEPVPEGPATEAPATEAPATEPPAAEPPAADESPQPLQG